MAAQGFDRGGLAGKKQWIYNEGLTLPLDPARGS